MGICKGYRRDTKVVSKGKLIVIGYWLFVIRGNDKKEVIRTFEDLECWKAPCGRGRSYLLMGVSQSI